MLLYVFLIALLNLGMGFALAVYLGKRPSLAGRTAQPLPDGPAGAIPDSPAGGLLLAENEDTRVATGERLWGDAEEGRPSVSGFGEVGSSAPSAEHEGAAESQPAADSSEALISELQDHVRRYDQALVAVVDELRRDPSPSESEWLESRLKSLHETNEAYLKNRDELHGAFESLHRGTLEYGPIRDNLQETADRQSHRIREVDGDLAALNYQGDLDEICRHVAGQANKLVEVNHHVRDIVDEVMLGVVRGQQSLPSISPARRTDPLTRTCNRAGLEAALAEWWSKAPHRSRQLNAALIDVDHFRQLNERCGPRFGDEVLRAIAQLLALELRGNTVVARYRGQQFAALFHDADLRHVTGGVEKVRQTVETTVFQTSSHQAQVTLSCGLTEAVANDTSESLFARLETTVQEAKRYGRNRTFVHDGKYPTPVVPPNFTLEPRTVVL